MLGGYQHRFPKPTDFICDGNQDSGFVTDLKEKTTKTHQVFSMWSHMIIKKNNIMFSDTCLQLQLLWEHIMYWIPRNNLLIFIGTSLN